MIEKELIEECRKGDLSNFRRIVDKTSPLIFSVAFRMTGDDNIARDIVQDTMITVWQKIGKIKSSECFNTWIYRIAVNKCYDHLRKRKREPEYRFDDEAWALISNHISDEAAPGLENKENAEIINFLTGKLSPKQKEVFILSELEEMSTDEIMEITGMYRSSVKANLYYARKNIRSLFNKYLQR